MSNRKVLLVEPHYKNKYPPIGLMKLATYHKLLGDTVVFFKGELKLLVLEQILSDCIDKLSRIDNSINWKNKHFLIREYIKKRNRIILEDIGLSNSKYEILLLNAIEYYKKYYWNKEYYKNPYWDRVCITSLFTFEWEKTIRTIEFCKKIVKSTDELWVGGILATVMNSELSAATNIKKIVPGLLNKAGILDDNEIIIDNLPLDYSILEEIDYKYPENNAYYGYTTRGCIRKCNFCAVPQIEPKYIPYISLSDKIQGVIERFGEKQNLLLLDNNVLASPRFPEIINEIKNSGFDKKSKYIEPNQLEISIRNINSGINVNGYLKKSVTIFHELINRLKGPKKQEVYNYLFENHLLDVHTATIQNINNVFPIINPLYEKYRNKVPKQRVVDFNQGVDARLLTDKKAKLLSEIPINPLRIAFDSMKFKDTYITAVLNANKYGIKNLSNYILYNYEDKPIELYQRLRINVELSDKYDLTIYSFPMKYHPITGNNIQTRRFVGKHWNRKFIRAVQIILNATKGKIGKGKEFFYKAFGKDEKEFSELLYMPETYLFYRLESEKKGLTDRWRANYKLLNSEELKFSKKIIENNDFEKIDPKTMNDKIRSLMNHYSINRKDTKIVFSPQINADINRNSYYTQTEVSVENHNCKLS